MLIGVGDKILTTQNNRVFYRLPDILEFFGINILFLDARRYANYRLALPAHNTFFNNISTPPANLTGAAVFAYEGSGGSPTNFLFSRAEFGFPAFKFNNAANKVGLSCSTLNVINGANSITFATRIKVDSVNTANNIGSLCTFINNTSNAGRFNLAFNAAFDLITLEVNNTDTSSAFYLGLTSLSSILGKLVTLIVDFNYISKTARCWINGRLVITHTFTTMTSANIPNTNSAYISIGGASSNTWLGYFSIIRVAINSAITNNDVIKIHNHLEYLTFEN